MTTVRNIEAHVENREEDAIAVFLQLCDLDEDDLILAVERLDTRSTDDACCDRVHCDTATG